MKIRPARKDDIPQIIGLCEAHAEYEQSAYNRAGKAELLFDYLFQQEEVVNCLVVVEQEVLVGYATFMKQFSTWNAAHYLYMDCLFLHESARGKGIGQQLMAKLKAIAAQKGCAWLEWQTPVFNKKAVRFYHKIGATSKSKIRFNWD